SLVARHFTTPAFFQDRDLTCFQIFKELLLPAGPEDLDAIDFHGWSKAEVQPQITLREITPSTADFVDLPVLSGNHGNSGSDTVSVGLLACGLDKNPVLLFAQVLEQARQVIHIVDDDFETAIVVQIPQGRSSRAAAVEYGRSRLRGNVQELSL